MLKHLFSKYNCKELVYIPFTADKGDCPYCDGVLRRDDELQEKLRMKETYRCNGCGLTFKELANRYFVRFNSLNNRGGFYEHESFRYQRTEV